MKAKNFLRERSGCFTFLIKNVKPGLLFATGTSSKLYKRAVDRNRIKRLIREAYRLQKNELQKKIVEQQKSLALFFLYTGKELPEYKDIYLNSGKILSRLDQIMGKEN